MTEKKKIAKYISLRHGLNMKEAEAIASSVFKCIANQLADGEEVHITGFGKFSVSESPERAVYVPATGKTYMKPETRRLRFRASKILKHKINSNNN